MPLPISLSNPLPNLHPLLRDINTILGENYTFYHECVIAITDAAARHEDASAWFEQMQMVVEGVEEVQFSHAGVLFLLGERVRGEIVLGKMLPPLVPRRKKAISRRMKSMVMPEMDCRKHFAAGGVETPLASASATAIYNMASKKADDSPQSGLKAHSQDPVLFIDTALERTVRDFFGVTPFTGTNNSTPQHEPGTSSDIAYYDSKDIMTSYNPATDDLKDFKERAEQMSAVTEYEVLGESVCGENKRGFRSNLGLFNED